MKINARYLPKNLTRKESYKVEKYPPFMQRIFSAGGLMQSLKKKGKDGKN
jgi:hypothetical protein